MNLKVLYSIIVFCLYSLGAYAQNAKTYHVAKAGTLVEMMTESEANSITELTLTGKLNAVDFRHLRDEFNKLRTLDISNASISHYMGKNGTYTGQFYVYESNSLPPFAFCRLTADSVLVGKETLTHIILSEKTRSIKEAAFRGCHNLRICQINKKTPPQVADDALDADLTAVFVPLGCSDAYRMKKEWEKFAVIEGAPVGVSLSLTAEGALAGELLKTGLQPKEVNFLTLSGKLGYNDFNLIRDYMPNLVGIDMTCCTATAIPDYTFTQKKFLLTAILPNKLQRIGQRAFSGCFRLSGTLILPPTVTAIEYGAFIDCTNLKEVRATGGKLTTLGEGLFGEEKSKLVIE